MFRRFEQLSGSSGRRVMAKHVPGAIVASAGLEGFYSTLNARVCSQP